VSLDVIAAMGRSNKWIGYALGLAPSTVAGHLSSAVARLGFRSRTELILGLGGGVGQPAKEPTR
jgi:DNA-binding CsgD family transcriptional regulator